MTDENATSAEEEQTKKEVKKGLIESIFRGSNRPKNVRELGISTLKNLPGTVGAVQGFMKAVNWKQAQDEVLQGLNNTVVIVGQPNTGKSTLFNKIKGEQLSPVSAQAGTTRSLIRTDFGPFSLLDTPGIDKPGHLPDDVKSALEQASVIVFLIDATQGLQNKDRELYEGIKNLKKPLILAI